MYRFKGSFTLLFILLILTACNNYDFTSKFSTIPEKPQSDSKIEVLYSAKDTELADADSITMISYLFDITPEGVQEYKMRKVEGGFVGEITTSDVTSGILIKFVSNDKIDNNNEQGYTVKLYGRDGIPSAKFEGGLAVAYARWVPYAGFERDIDKAYKMFNDFFSEHPELKSHYLDHYLYTVSRVDPTNYQNVLETEIKTLENKETKTAVELGVLSNYLPEMSKDAGIYYNELLKNFPDSKEAQESMSKMISNETDRDKKLAMLKEFDEKFPQSERTHDVYDDVCQFLKDSGDFTTLIWLIENNVNKPSLYTYYSTVNALTQNNYDSTSTLNIARLGVERSTRDLKNPLAEKPKFMTIGEWQNDLRYYAGLNSFVYGKLLISNGQPQVALSYLKNAVDYTLEYNSREDINNSYIGCLLKVKDNDTAIKVIENFISKGKSDNEMKNTLKNLYVEKNGSEEGFENYVMEFEKLAYGELIEKVKKEMTNKPAPDFELKDMDGNTVKLSDLKGKTIILDFWATWCGPCRKSFPGMKIAVEKYAKDKSFEFLFVNTWERVDNKLENARDFMKKNNYPFHVLMDTENKVVSDYKVAGIPTKFVIDKNQNIRIISVGSEGSPEHIAQEVDVMLSMINK